MDHREFKKKRHETGNIPVPTKVINNKIILKKQFRAKKEFHFNQIQNISSFQLKNTKYITVSMKNNENSIEKYLIIETQFFFSKKEKDVEKTLQYLMISSNK